MKKHIFLLPLLMLLLSGLAYAKGGCCLKDSCGCLEGAACQKEKCTCKCGCAEGKVCRCGK